MERNLIIVQWDYYFGGLEKISKLYEEKFLHMNPLVAILRPIKSGFVYNNSFIFTTNNNFKFIIEYFLFARARRSSIFHLQYTGATVLLLTYLAGVDKILYHFHGTKFPTDHLTRVVWKILEKKVVIIANSKFTSKVVSEKLDIHEEIVVLPNLIDINDFAYKEREFKGDNFIITFVGRFDRGKNVRFIIEIARLVKNLDRSIHFLLVGDGPERGEIEKQILDYKLSEKVRVEPFTNKVADVYYKSHLLLFPSLYESFGNVVAEAILTGLPVLCHKIPALQELIEDETFFFDSTDANVVAKIIVDIKKKYNSKKQNLLKVNNYLRVYLNQENIIEKLNSIYMKLEK